MDRNVIKGIKWKYFLKHPIVKAFLENLDEDEFAKNLQIFIGGDKAFREIIGTDYLTNQDVIKIIQYIKKVNSRRRFLKGAISLAIATAAIGVTKQSGILDTHTTYSDGGLKVKGINYDIGTRYVPNFITRQELTNAIMQRELYVIKNQLHCNAVRIYGENIEKLIECSKIALSIGLHVWLSPRFIDKSKSETLELIKYSAIEAEKLRAVNPNIIFIVGNELTLDMKGMVPGETYMERGHNLFSSIVKDKLQAIFGSPNINNTLDLFLKEVASIVRQFFKGHITYAAGFWEKINWDNFDIVGANYYRNLFNSLTYTKGLGELIQFKKPVAILEFGCGSYKGAENKGGSSYDIVEWNAQRPFIKGDYKRDEEVQAKYIIDLINTFVKEGIFAAFVYTFVETHYIADDTDPKYDLDIASFNLIKVYPEWHEKAYIKGHIIPKKSFFAIGKFYGSH